MSDSAHRVEVVRLGPIEPHPNADSLGLTAVWGYTCVVRLADWREGMLAAYVPPDSVMPDRTEYAFLQGHRRIRVRRLRGMISQGLLLPAPDGAALGEDVAERLGITHYVPPFDLQSGGETASPPLGYFPVYDVESMRRYAHVFEPGEPVWITEKLHGASARYVWGSDDRLHCGSRTEWKREAAENPWWRAATVTPSIEAFCRRNPTLTLYGEVYGQLQDLKYGTARGEVRFAAFDLLEGAEWIAAQLASEMLAAAEVPTVPFLRRLPFALDVVEQYAEGPSRIVGAGHVREGCVVKPLVERTHPEVGRVNLKLVGNDYLSRSEA